MANIQDALAEAQAKAAEQTPAQTANVPATTAAAGGTAVAAHTGGPVSLSMDDVVGGSLAVDAFLKVNEDGLKIGDKPQLIETITVDIDLAQCVVAQVIKFGNPAVYYKTLDGMTTQGQGFTWSEAIMRAKQINPKADPYKSVDIPMTLVEDAKDLKGNVVVEAGTTLGHSTSTTNWANMVALLKAVDAKGYSRSTDTVRVTITSERRTNKNNNVWGVLKFELLGRADEFSDEGSDEATATPAAAENAA